MTNNDSTYWNSFYKSSDVKILVPSQFASFVASEYIGDFDALIDFGCGNGRDTNFFAMCGLRSLGIDVSSEAIATAQAKAGGSTAANFIIAGISNTDLTGKITAWRPKDARTVVYSRFFLHALSEDDEDCFWRVANDLCKPHDVIALEFRTNRDENLAKVTDYHYRRFIEPVQLILRAEKFGFECSYFVEGFGYAKYKTDDAYVARLIFTKIQHGSP